MQSSANTVAQSPATVSLQWGAYRASGCWSQTTPAERARLFFKAAEIVKGRRAEIAEILAGPLAIQNLVKLDSMQ